MTTGPQRFPGGNLRVSDADRDRALTELSSHFQAGRLSTEEFDERSGQALQAKTAAELNTLFADLPQDQAPWLGPSSVSGWSGPSVPAQTDQRPVSNRAGAVAPIVRTAAAVAVVAVIFIALAFGRDSGHPWGGLILPLIIILAIIRRGTRGRR